MRRIKPSRLKGILTVKVYGHYAERFFDLCARHDITVWSIKKLSQLECQGDVYLTDLRKIRKLRRKTRYKLSFINKTGLPFWYKHLKNYRLLLTSLLIGLVAFIYLSQSIWTINITGTSTEMEAKIGQSLADLGVRLGKIKWLIDSPAKIQEQILAEHSNLLWVGIKQSGISYQLEIVEKKQIEPENKTSNLHLYARKDGVISRMFVSKGRPVVEVNDFVRKGQLLVTGELSNREEETDEQPLVNVEAEVFATTWYESRIQIPLSSRSIAETGRNNKKYFLSLANFKLPIWGFFSDSYNAEYVERSIYTPTLFNWKFPVSLLVNEHKETQMYAIKRTENEAIQIGLQQAKNQLLAGLGHDAEVVEEKILQQTIENGKVNIHVYLTVTENIVNTTESIQGD